MKDQLNRIISLCETPYWTADRKNRIAELAREVLRELERQEEKQSVPIMIKNCVPPPTH